MNVTGAINKLYWIYTVSVSTLQFICEFTLWILYMYLFKELQRAIYSTIYNSEH